MVGKERFFRVKKKSLEKKIKSEIDGTEKTSEANLKVSYK